ncbi:MAG: hypothetical protein ACRENP_08825 [Longimicrobiales bacterium]
MTTVTAAQEPARWRLNADGRAFAQYMQSGTLAGTRAFGSANWFMADLRRESGDHRFVVAGMVSAEPLTLGECGYPRLLTPGFLCFDNVLEDRQHTHPLVMGLSASYERVLSESSQAHVQASLVGEPAFGPAPYFHRASAQFDPIAPLTNDLLNPAHTAYGVVTAGATIGQIAWQASVFNGAARDHNPYDFDIAPLHSYATRAALFLSDRTRVQASVADFQPAGAGSAHHGHGGGRMRAWSASLEHQVSGAERTGALTIAWAAHHAGGETAHSGLLEGQVTRARHTMFGRLEMVERIELEATFVDLPDGTHQHIVTPRRFWVGEVNGGYAHRLISRFGLDASLGARASMNSIPAYISPRYNADLGFGFAVFALIARSGTEHHH